MSQFTIGEKDFLLDGEPFQILSGALHYFRVHPDLWRDRIRKARLMGLNTIETYVAWNAHAPERETFRTDGALDLARFLDIIAEEGMYAIVRPGPYICAEWANGGLPPWLFSDAETGIRRNEPRYMAAIAEYLGHLAPILAPRQIDRGGPIILVQVENEYGAYGNDASYLEALVTLYREMDLTVPYTTVDQPEPDMLVNGSLPSLHKTGSFGSRVPERLAALREHQPSGPLMCSEFWNGWFDHWGEHHHTTSAAEAAGELEALLSVGASVNIYMFHGGTNFGFTNGANDKGVYKSLITSYDYDAPLDESGEPTEKYWAYREILARYGSVPAERPEPAVRGIAADAPITSAASLWEVRERITGPAHTASTPATFDELGVNSGFLLYSAAIEAPVDGPLVLTGEVRDRVQVFLDERSAGILARDHHDRVLPLPDGAAEHLDLLVEDLGRVNYGPRLGEPKGIIGDVQIGSATVAEWQVRALELDRVQDVVPGLAPVSGGALGGPVFARTVIETTQDGDLFLDMQGWGKGVVWVNGFSLGRYWSRGAQRTLYIPAPVLVSGENEIIVFELHGTDDPVVRFSPVPELGHLEF